MHPKLGSDGNGGYVWKGKVDEFRGEVIAKLELYHEDIVKVQKQTDVNTKSISRAQGAILSVGVLSGLIGICLVLQPFLA